jgi:hypothetical protein
MPSDNPAVVGNQYWIVETKTFDRCGDLLDLGLANDVARYADRA